jgi:protein involved in sex pheromone biosynthesis
MKKTLAILMLATMLLSSCGLNKVTSTPPHDNLKNDIQFPRQNKAGMDGDVVR